MDIQLESKTRNTRNIGITRNARNYICFITYLLIHAQQHGDFFAFLVFLVWFSKHAKSQAKDGRPAGKPEQEYKEIGAEIQRSIQQKKP